MMTLEGGMVMPHPLAKPSSVVTVTIPAGQSVSDTVDCTTTSIDAILMPANWSAANAAIQVSLDGTSWYDLYDANGEVVRPCKANCAVLIGGSNAWSVAGYMRFRSGTSSYPVVQETDAVFSVLME